MSAITKLEEAMFFAALNVEDPGQRKLFLDQACAGNDRLRAAVEEMLSANADAEQFFARSKSSLSLPEVDLQAAALVKESGDLMTSNPLDDDWIGGRIGRYKLLQKIGTGGCGTVYLAEQQEPIRRQVALKVIKLGMDTKAVIASFEAERQALALMEHPNIARVLDAGATEMGRPYFVMEWVRGVRINDYCDQTCLDTGQRLRLFIQICHAIQHAHQKGVIHRDIKPSNILVTLHDKVAMPKVIDFGIAKATECRGSGNTMPTAREHFMGTPAYMSPEQAEVGVVDVDTRSDIYSLGVLLYELLTGRTPFDQKELMQSGLDGMSRTLREKQPLWPSAMLATFQANELKAIAGHHHEETPQLASFLKSDLDWIVMKALEKDRTRRYETANGLAMDIERFLNHEPVMARPHSRLYRFQKLARRNKIVFATGVVVALALIIGLGTSTWLFFKERESAREAERGRTNEVLLRQEAQAREKIAQATVLIAQNQFEEADRLVAEIPTSKAAFDGATVFRALGDWAAIQGQWKRAVERFTTLLQIDRFETTDIASLDQIRCGVALVEQGDKEGYERFRRSGIQRFLATTDPISVERVVRNSLLLPADSDVIQSLAPLAKIVEDSIYGRPSTAPNDSLRCATLTLMEYRRNHYAEAIDWGKRCLTFVSNNNAPRVATVRVILAMAYYQSGQAESARSELVQGREIIGDKFNSDLRVGNGKQGYWFDWIFAHLLLHEATNLIEPPTVSEPPAS